MGREEQIIGIFAVIKSGVKCKDKTVETHSCRTSHRAFLEGDCRTCLHHLAWICMVCIFWDSYSLIDILAEKLKLLPRAFNSLTFTQSMSFFHSWLRTVFFFCLFLICKLVILFSAGNRHVFCLKFPSHRGFTYHKMKTAVVWGRTVFSLCCV